MKRRTIGVCTSAVTVAAAAVAVAAPAAAVEPASQFRSAPSACAQTNGRVSAIEISGDTAYLGGDFTEVIAPGGQRHARNRAAAIDTSTCEVLPWNPDVDGAVLALEATGDTVFLGGKFSRVGGDPRINLAEVTGTDGNATDFRHTVKGQVMALGASSTRLYAAGGISAVDGSPRGKAAAFSLATGALDTNWRPTADRKVQALAVAPDASRVYLGGSFSSINGDAGTRNLVAVSPTSGAVDGSFRPDIRVQTTELLAQGTSVAAAMAGSGGRVAVFQTNGALRVEGRTDGNAQAVALAGEEVVAGGHFGNFCVGGNCNDPVRRSKALSMTLSGALTDFAPQFNSTFGVWALAYDPATGRLFAGGDFTQSKNINVSHLAMFTS